jgi:hypothetical protein
MTAADSLTPAEFASLKKLSSGETLAPIIPAEHEDRLRELGLADRVAGGGLKLTDAGKSLLQSRS